MTSEIVLSPKAGLALFSKLEHASEPEDRDELWCHDQERRAVWERLDSQKAEDVTRSRTPRNP
ncbi:hypothetical protein [Curtobacterium sp. USHLN213]|uniref:hypothetical protein n=1 Tax=Curtobacterium sp. USHLN213 TaxID=3081255 RepID=UPI003019B0D6